MASLNMSSNKTTIALFGGSFNPPHLGHINTLLDLQVRYQFPHIGLMPNAISPHKLATPPVSIQHRLAMLNLSIATHPSLYIEDYELLQPQPSYSVSTLRHFAANHNVFFIIGEDSLQSLHTWHDYLAILQLCHLIVLPRLSDEFAAKQRTSLQENVDIASHQTQIEQNITTQETGPITFKNGQITRVCLAPVDISSTQCRTELKNPQIESQYIAPSVLNYIRKHHLYAD